MSPEALWNEFETAYLSRPGAQIADDDMELLIEGNTLNVGQIKKSYEKVIHVWVTTDLFNLFSYGYDELLPNSIMAMVTDYKNQLHQAHKRIIKNVFHSS